MNENISFFQKMRKFSLALESSVCICVCSLQIYFDFSNGIDIFAFTSNINLTIKFSSSHRAEVFSEFSLQFFSPSHQLSSVWLEIASGIEGDFKLSWSKLRKTIFFFCVCHSFVGNCDTPQNLAKKKTFENSYVWHFLREKRNFKRNTKKLTNKKFWCRRKNLIEFFPSWDIFEWIEK